MKFLVLLLVAAIAVNTKGLLHGDKGDSRFIACAEMTEIILNLLFSLIFYAAHKLHKAWAEHNLRHCDI